MTPEHRAKLEHIASEAIMADTREAITAALARIDALEAEVAELRRDKERLDWLEKHCDAIDHSGWRPDDDSWEVIYYDGNRAGSPYLRDAIDAAREGR